MKTLLNLLAVYINLSIDDAKEIERYTSLKKLKKGEILTREFEVCDHLAFINQGFFRIFLRKEQDEATTYLAGPGSFITSIASFVERIPSVDNIQSITNSEVYLIKYEHLQSLYNKKHKFEKLGRILLEKYLIAKEERIISFITESPEERYTSLIKKSPELILNIPLQHIASYLGVKPETLSRIRARLNSTISI